MSCLWSTLVFFLHSSQTIVHYFTVAVLNLVVAYLGKSLLWLKQWLHRARRSGGSKLPKNSVQNLME